MSSIQINLKESGEDHACCSSVLGKRKEMTTKAWNNEAARKLTRGQIVYVKDTTKAWVPAVVIEDCGDRSVVTVQLKDELIISINSSEVVSRSEETELFTFSSLTELNPVNEASALECLHQRFSHDIFYTAAGTTIVALNPFKDVPSLYSVSKVYEYHRSIQTLEPHIFVIGEKAYTNMLRESGRINQSIVVSGESGAGKTVSAKHLLKYLTIVSSPEKQTDLNCSMPASVIERQILDSNPILEAFGNAATPRNENSSRFGKFIQLQFHRNGYILGAVVQTYLLEKTRVMHKGLGENNFHIFYQLMSLGGLSSVPAWLEEVKSEVLDSKLICEVPQQAETMSVLQTVKAMEVIGVSPANQVSIFKILLAIFHLSAMQFISVKDGEASSLSSGDVSTRSKDECSRLLGISSLSLLHALLNRKIVSGTKTHQSIYVKPVTVSEARSRRDSLVMLLYSRLFDWLVSFINSQIKATVFDHCINLLDIYGFETFVLNNLEQLCINYANERLQQHYVTHFLRDLQTEYESEQIAWTPIDYKDNKLCVETLHGPSGVFGILNEEVALNRTSENSSVCSRIIAACSAQGFVRRHGAGTYETKFIVRHYAGDVIYTVEDAVIKNKDNIPAELISLVASSQDMFVQDLFTNDDFAYTEQSLTPTKTRKKITVLTKFKSSLDNLMNSLERSDVHFIRCIKPNTSNRPNLFDRPYVLQQLEACGTLETVNICRLGYPARMDYQEFLKRYGFMTKLKNVTLLKAIDNQHTNQLQSSAIQEFYDKVDQQMSNFEHLHNTGFKRLRSACSTEDMYKQCARILPYVFPFQVLHTCHTQFGKHKLFLTQIQMDHLEHTRASVISDLVARVQAAWKKLMIQRYFQKCKLAVVRIQATWRMCSARLHFSSVRLSAIKIQRAWQVYKLSCAVKSLAKSSRIVRRFLACWVRRHRFKKALQRLHLERLQAMSQLEESSYNIKTSNVTIFSDQIHSKENMENLLMYGPLDDHLDMLGVDFSDTSSQCSDDSGVMIKDDIQSLTGDSAIETPPLKKHPVSQRDFRIGNGIITCRRLTKPGFRFHVRRSVLKFGHLGDQCEVMMGLSGIIEDEQPNRSVDTSKVVIDC